MSEVQEPDWSEGCSKTPGEECRDCLYQRAYFGYILENGKWAKKKKKKKAITFRQSKEQSE